MATLILRTLATSTPATTGADTTKASPLTNAQIDQNFININADLTTLTTGVSGAATKTGSNPFTGANTFYNTIGQTFGEVATNDSIIIKGRAGGTSSYRVTLIPATLTSTGHTITIPAETGTIVTTGSSGVVTNSMLSGTIGDRGVRSDSTSVSFVTYKGTTATAGYWDGGATSPTDTTYRLNFSGKLYASQLFGNVVNATRANASSGSQTPLLSVTMPTDTGITAATEQNSIKFTGGTRTWAAGAIVDQREVYLTSPSYAFASASTITNAYGLYVAKPTAGANATITNNYGIGTDGDIKLGSSTLAGGSAFRYTLPTVSSNSTIVTTGDSGTVTNDMLSGSIANSKLTSSAITINGSSTSLGNAITLYAGRSSLQTTSGDQALVGVYETKVAPAGVALDLSTGSYFTKTIAANTTFTVSNVPTTGTAASIILELTNAGAYTIGWGTGFTSVKWAGGTAPVFTASGVDIIGLYTHDAGATWRGIFLSKDSR